MSDLDIKRLNGLTDELEKRIKTLETKKANKEEIITVSENASNLLFKPTNKAKSFKFISNEKSFVAVSIELLSPATFTAQLEVYANGQIVKNQAISFPFSCEIPMQTVIGENALKVVVYTNSTTASFKLDINVSITGKIAKKEDVFGFCNILNDSVFFRHNDAIKDVNTNTMETIACYTNKDLVSVGFSRGNFVAYLVKENGVFEFIKHWSNSNDSYMTKVMPIDCSDCALEIHNGVTYIVMIKGENVYMYGNMQDGTTFLQKLPFKAKSIKSLNGKSGRYIYYTDVRGNLTVVKHYSYTDYREESSVSLGKLENANLSEEDGKLMVLYKQGLVVLKKPVYVKSTPVVVGVGDEAVITEQGVTIIRKKDKLIRL